MENFGQITLGKFRELTKKYPQSARFIPNDDQTEETNWDGTIVEYDRKLNAFVVSSTAVHLKEKK